MAMNKVRGGPDGCHGGVGGNKPYNEVLTGDDAAIPTPVLA